MRGPAVGPFEERHLQPAAELLAGQYPYYFEFSEVPAARRFVDGWYGTCPAVAAERDGKLVGFMAAALPKTPGEPVAKIRAEQHCAIPDGRRDIYRALYGALSGQLVAADAFHHMITVATAHTGAITDFFQLGFGIDQIRGRRRPSRHERPRGIRPARPEDIPGLVDLAAEVTRFHSEPPMLGPALVDLGMIRDNYHAALEHERELLLVAEHDGRLAGLMQAGPDPRYRNTATIGLAGVTATVRSRGLGCALVAGVLDWAADRDFATCNVEWTSANPISDPFWRGHGFDPVQYKLIRRIDTRIAGADPRDVPSVGLEPTL